MRHPLIKTSNKPATNLHLEALAGLQREALIFIYGNCRNLGSKVSPPIQIKNLAQVIKSSVAVARVTVQRIETKGFISRVEYKEGRGGWTKYKLPDEIYSQLLFHETSNKSRSIY